MPRPLYPHPGHPAPEPDAVPSNWLGGCLLLYLSVVLIPIGLKLVGFTRVATWSWWWVTVPLWGVWVLLVVLAAIGFFLRWKNGLRDRA